MRRLDCRALAMAHKGALRYFTPARIRERLADAETWFHVKRIWCGRSASLYVRLDGDLTFIGRADLFGQVHSSIGGTSCDGFYRDPLKHYLDSASYGAVLIDRREMGDQYGAQGLFMLDSCTDG